ncbi:MAG: ImmA/IrrE family metallo-endopeptidase [Lachnospiraceae bacterium]|nr:ImmA/IrrE family metallo-endopeptidase [Lachnospiraceae bacterium]
MYRSGSEYDEIAKIVIQIYLDYGICKFPIDEYEVCRKLGVSLVSYSVLDKEFSGLLLKRTKHGIFVRRTPNRPPTIYFNDKFEPYGARRYTIFHEVKHYVYDEDSGDEEYDDLADYFARYFMCPIPYLIYKGFSEPDEIISFCNVSIAVANNVCSNLYNRRNKYGSEIFDYERPLIEYLNKENQVLIEKVKNE